MSQPSELLNEAAELARLYNNKGLDDPSTNHIRDNLDEDVDVDALLVNLEDEVSADG